jgi:hypothetical protein
VLHFGFELSLGGTTYSARFLYPAAFLEAGIALALLLSVLLPGSGQVRAGRVIAAQVMSVLAMFAIQIGMMRGPEFATARNEIFYGVAFVLSVVSLVLAGSPAYRRRRFAH